MALIDSNTVACTNNVSNVLRSISQLLQKDVVIDGRDGQWVRFHVVGMDETAAAMQLETQKELGLGPDWWKYQVLCASDPPRQGTGLWIQELEGPLANEYLCGVWLF